MPQRRDTPSRCRFRRRHCLLTVRYGACPLLPVTRRRRLCATLPPSPCVPRPPSARTVFRRKVNVSFLLLYYKHPDNIEKLSKSLWECTHGSLGTGQIPGVTSELLVCPACAWSEFQGCGLPSRQACMTWRFCCR